MKPAVLHDLTHMIHHVFKSKMYLDISSFTNIPKPTVPGCASGLHADSCGAGASRIRFSPFLSTCSTKNVNGSGVHDYQCFHKCWTTIWNDMETQKSTKSRKANLSHGFNSPKKRSKANPFRQKTWSSIPQCLSGVPYSKIDPVVKTHLQTPQKNLCTATFIWPIPSMYGILIYLHVP